MTPDQTRRVRKLLRAVRPAIDRLAEMETGRATAGMVGWRSHLSELDALLAELEAAG